jgi:hypothetical protein
MGWSSDTGAPPHGVDARHKAGHDDNGAIKYLQSIGE